MTTDDDVAASGSTATPAARRAVGQLLHDREAAYLDEYARLVEAVYAVAARTGTVDPKVADIVAEAGLSNQAFYRHFASKDALMSAVLDDGRHRLVDYLEHRMAQASEPKDAIAAWIRGVLAQATDEQAAARSRPFAVHSDRLAARFPDAQGDSVTRLREQLVSPVSEAVVAGDLPDSALRYVDFVFWTVFDTLQRHLTVGSTPSRGEIGDLVIFCLAGLGATPGDLAH